MSGEVVIQTVMERRSCRKYDQRRVPHAVLERIVEAGRRAPTGMDRQELNFYVVETPEVAERIGSETAPAAMKAVPHLIDRVKQMGISNPITCGAPACVVVTVRNEPELLKYAQIDTGLAVENMLIAAQALGLRGLPVALAAAFNERAWPAYVVVGSTVNTTAHPTGTQKPIVLGTSSSATSYSPIVLSFRCCSCACVCVRQWLFPFFVAPRFSRSLTS